MLQTRSEQGISEAILTQRVESDDREARDELQRHGFSDLQEAVNAAAFDLRIYLGAEITFRFGIAEVARWRWRVAPLCSLIFHRDCCRPVWNRGSSSSGLRG